MRSKKLVIRIITTPYRALCKARDFYVRSITDCANHNSYAVTHQQLPRSYSTTSSLGSTAEEDLRELIRANSTNGFNHITRADLELYIRQHQHQHMMVKPQPSRKVAAASRSASVGMGRIDEDAPALSDSNHLFTFNGKPKAKSNLLVFPRSKSHAPALTRSTNNPFS